MLSLDDIDKYIEFCEFEAKRIERRGCSEWIQESQIKESANRFRQIAKGLTELKAWRKFDESRRMKCEED